VTTTKTSQTPNFQQLVNARVWTARDVGRLGRVMKIDFMDRLIGGGNLATCAAKQALDAWYPTDWAAKRGWNVGLFWLAAMHTIDGDAERADRGVSLRVGCETSEE
jgi:hypothetical protein